MQQTLQVARRTGWLLFFCLCLAGLARGQAPTDLYFSEYIEGSSNNKALEIYNGTGAAINLATGQYVVQFYFNGSSTAGLSISLTGTVAASDVFVLAQSSASATILAQADQTNGSGWYNGDDAIVLRKGGASGTILDVIGQLGSDPGTEWGTGLTSTADNTLRRKVTICAGDTDGSNAFDPSVQWDGYAVDTFDGLGSHSATCGAPDTAPMVTASIPANAATNVALSTNITLTFSEAVTATASSFTVEAPTGTPVAFALSGGSTTFTLNPSASLPVGTVVTVTALASAIADQDGTPTSLASNYIFSFTTVAVDPCTVPTLISTVQGTGTASPLVGTTVTISGVVVGDFQNTAGTTRLGGFYVQEEAADVDASSATSEGIFVYEGTGTFLTDVTAGDRVCLSGTVTEFTGGASSLTQLTNPSITVLGTASLPAITSVQLPVANVSDLERYEGMLVTVSAASGNLTVTEHFQLGRFGQVLLSATGSSNQPGTDARLDQYTQFNAPSVAGNAAHLADLARRRIYLDDGISTQNPDPILFGRGGNPLSASNPLRGGDEVASITGPLDERFEGYRVQINSGVNFTPANARPTTVPAVGGTLKVASANVLNYFNGNGSGGGFPTSRGADNLTEFNRQRAKVLATINGLGADVIGLNEVENDGYGSTSAIQDLVNGLNALAGAGTYAFINPGVALATDQITVGMIYKPANVTLVGAAATISNGTEFDVVGRKPLAQTFQQTATGAQVTVVANHFKSKGSASAGTGNSDIGDGQGESNGTRTRQAQALATWLATNPTGATDPDYLIVGDLNAYALEDPLTALATAGYANLLPNTTYSYVFNGQWGSLDHALGSTTLAAQLDGAAKWHINADEPAVLDYNTEFKSAGQITSLYSPDAFRSADHDPVLVGLNLVVFTITPSPVALTQGQTLTGVTIATVNDAGSLPAGATVTASSGSNGVSLSNVSLNTSTGVVTADVVASCPATSAGFTLTLNGGGNATTPTATLDVTANPLVLTASIGGGSTICVGGSTVIPFSGTPNTTVTYTINGGTPQAVMLDGTGVTQVTTGPLTSTTVYALVSVSNGVCTQSASGSSTVTVRGTAYTSTPTVTGAPACAGATIRVSFTFTATCAFPGNVFTAELSDPSGSFETVTVLGSVTPGITTLSLPISLPTGNGYRVRIRSSQPEYVSGASAAFTINAPNFNSTPTVSSDNKCPGEAVRLSFSVACPFPAGSVFTAELSNASGSFASPTPVGTVTPGLNNVVIPAGTPAGTGYRLRVVNTSSPTLYSAVSGSFKVKACGNTREAAPEETGLRVNVSPNPSPEGKLRIHIGGAEGQALRVELFNGTGQPVRQQVVDRAGTEEILTWDVTRQPQGLYLLRVSGQRETKTVKVLH